MGNISRYIVGFFAVNSLDLVSKYFVYCKGERGFSGVMFGADLSNSLSIFL